MREAEERGKMSYVILPLFLVTGWCRGKRSRTENHWSEELINGKGECVALGGSGWR